MSSHNLEFNKIAGAVLLAGVIAMSSSLMAEGLYNGGHHSAEIKRGFAIEVAQATPAATGAKADEKPVDIMPLMASADAAAGQTAAKKCSACHTFDKGGKNGVGPNLSGIVGRAKASQAGFTYSAALTGMSGKKWDEQNLSDYIENPKKYAPGNKMAFAGIKNPQERANLIAYLKTLK